jgi:hypothetical protein
VLCISWDNLGKYSQPSSLPPVEPHTDTHSLQASERKKDALNKVERSLACHHAQHTRLLVSIRKHKVDAVKAAKSGDREGAKQFLKRRKGLMGKASKVEHLVDMCQQVMDSYADGEMVRDTVSALTDAQMIFNPSEANHLYEQLGKATEDIVDAKDVMEDVGNVLRESSERVSSADADDLESELEALMREDVDSQVFSEIEALPTAPRGMGMSRNKVGATEVPKKGLHTAYANMGLLPKTDKVALHAD